VHAVNWRENKMNLMSKEHIRSFGAQLFSRTFWNGDEVSADECLFSRVIFDIWLYLPDKKILKRKTSTKLANKFL